MRRTAIPAIAAAFVFLSVPAAFAQSADCTVEDGYTKTCPTEATAPPEVAPIKTEVKGVKVVNTAPTTTTGGTTLPMTGAELTGFVLAGLALVGGGTTLVVAGRRRKHPTA